VNDLNPKGCKIFLMKVELNCEIVYVLCEGLLIFIIYLCAIKDLLKYNPYRFQTFLGYMTHNGMSFVAYFFSINYFTFINLLEVVIVKSLVWNFFQLCERTTLNHQIFDGLFMKIVN
jgi:hypothetical protein